MKKITINAMASDNTDILLAGTYINKGDYTNASAKVANLSLLDPEQSAYKSLYNILIDLGQNGLTIMDLNATQEQTVKIIADGTTRAKYPAQAIREVKNDIFYPRAIEKWSGNLTENGNEDRSQNSDYTIIQDVVLTVFPNPANDEVKVTWKTSMPDIDRILRITNLQGKVVKFLLLTTTNGSNIISLTDIPAGSYYVSIGSAANNLTQKLIIIK